MKINGIGNESVMLSEFIPRFEKIHTAQQALSCKDINT